ncbi:class I SAM-dependent methyltransferase [Halorussus caseinilyticus]|uniref:Class I SAM-dependent methyltransferase n=1 Tax=Halorussus caseinilyticus TaxID=3034025 RepID=A0ABD5WNG3_9EURY|nr:class I SAM-dependent methyltransferase [Halorussus sp. DT72]
MSRFDFGRNWDTFLAHLDEERIERATRELRSRFGTETLDGETFLDFGCGSGLFSLAAHRLGADRIVSLDYDADSVDCCRRLRANVDADDWDVRRADLLDTDEIRALDEFDYVYCWGVAHHTGDMWRAIDNLTRLVADGGTLCLGLYQRRDSGLWNSHRARRLKRFYNDAPAPVRTLLVLGWGSAVLAYRTVRLGENPVRHVREYEENRGMSFWTDVRDWVGGYPFEFASPEEVRRYFDREHGAFELLREDVPSDSPSAVCTYVFRKSGRP